MKQTNIKYFGMKDKARLLKNINRVATVVMVQGEESPLGWISGFSMNG